METDVVVSIICNTYNHEKYVADALESFLMQKTDFKYEVLVHDDASTDKTADVIRQYEKKYPDIIKPIYQTENQHSQKIPVMPTYQFPRVKGKYIAFCEGDDYWTDSSKLQKQFDALEAHPEIDICAHTVTMVNADTKESINEIKPSEKDCVFPLEEVVLGHGGFVGTNSLMYRAEINNDIPLFRKMYGLDYFLQLHGSLRGGMLYLADNMSSYRTAVTDSWTTRMFANIDKYIHHFERLILSLEELNRFTEFKYDEVIKKEILKTNYKILYYKKDYSPMLSPKYKELYKKTPFKTKLKLHFPVLEKIRDWIKK
ncbi:MAG: glycosyltransferase [Clostridia bacterium]|nr:glycosyltransferase [Clostridia bacterium]